MPHTNLDLTSLNEQQKEAVTYMDGPLLVVAGAGSGKTRVVTYKIAYLIEQGLEAESIAAMTFTNKAAKEMRERLEAMGYRGPWIGTFHSFGLRILRQYGTLLGLSARFVIYDPEDALKLLKQIEPSARKEEFKQWQAEISRAKNEAIAPLDWIDSALALDTPLEDPERFTKIYSAYEKIKFECGAVDFDDLLYLCVRLFKEEPPLLARLRKRWNYLLIDEYQDTNQCQYLIAQALAGESGALVAVGDPDQSIYSWRGANINNILCFEEDFPSAKTINLNCNYRSTQQILRAADHVIAHNLQRLPKTLVAARGEGDPVSLQICYDDRHEASNVVETIQELMNDGYRGDDIAIFYRTNFQSRAFEDAMISAYLPYQIIGGLSFYQRKEIKDILSLLRLIAYPSDYISFARMINIPKRGIGATSIQKIVSFCSEHGISPEDLLCDSSMHSFKLTKKVAEGLSDFFTLIRNLRQSVTKASLADLIEESIDIFGYKAYLRKYDEDPQEREENLHELIAKGYQWQQSHPERQLEDFLEEIALTQNQDGHELNESIKMMTLHNSKGLEFPVVFLVGLEEQLFPHVYTKIEEPNVEEERRLFYVGMTRAEQQLFISCCRLRFLWGTVRRMNPSRFLYELPSDDLIILNEEALPIDSVPAKNYL